MSVRATKHTFTKLVDEPFFIRCGENLTDDDGNQVATISSIDTQRLERKVTESPETETWEVAVDSSGFSTMQILADGSYSSAMIGGVLTADPDTAPAPGEDYMLVVECTIAFVAGYGGGSAERVFRRPARIAPSASTAPSA